MATFDTSSSDDEEDCYYHYDHASGRHVLNKRQDHQSRRAKQPPKYTLKCICCNLIDVLIFVGCIAFLFFAVRYAFYLLDNYGDGGD
mmetsp:Transcript_10168/g.22606  ORF Transcript_10168/g.22606 Transcript_10168/m.22606 type:complete len:87 (-) Transcript_10168:1141-1401(-)